MLLEGFEFAIPADEWPHSYVLERTATSFGIWISYVENISCHYLLNYFTEKSSSKEAHSSSASQEISSILWSQKFHYRFHKSPPRVSILSQIHSVHGSIQLFKEPQYPF